MDPPNVEQPKNDQEDEGKLKEFFSSERYVQPLTFNDKRKIAQWRMQQRVCDFRDLSVLI